jgi:hypothetical protein
MTLVGRCHSLFAQSLGTLLLVVVPMNCPCLCVQALTLIQTTPWRS